jgi:hypothetical protein
MISSPMLSVQQIVWLCYEPLSFAVRVQYF